MKKKRVAILTTLLTIFTPAIAFASENQKAGWFEKLIEKFLGLTLESAFQKSSDLLSTWAFQTPKLINYTWVTKLWWFCFITGIILMGIGVGIISINLFRGKKVATNGILMALIVAFLGGTLSLYISDYIIGFSNSVVDSLVHETLVTEYHKSENEAAIIESELEDDEINFGVFDGPGLIKVAFGGDLTDEEPIYKTFSLENGGGGPLIILWAMSVFWLIGIFSIVRYGLLGILGAVAPYWFSICAYTGDTRPAIGYINLFTRSVLLSWIFDIVWLFSVYVNRSVEFVDIGRQIIGCILFTVGLIAAIWFWFRWVVKAAMKPVTLAGGQVQEHYGNMLEKAGGSIENVGNRLGFEGMQVRGGEFKAVGGEHRKIAGEKKEGTYTGGANDRLAEARNRYQYETYKNMSKEQSVKDMEYGEAEVTNNLSQIDTLGMSVEEIMQILVRNNLEDIAIIDNDKVMVDEVYEEKVKEILNKEYKNKYVEELYLNGEKGYALTGVDYHPELLDLLKEDISYKDAEIITVEKAEIDNLISKMKLIKAFDRDKITEMPNSLGIELNRVDMVRAEKMFKSHDVDYSKSGNYLWFKKEDYEAMLNRVNIAKEILDKNKTNKDGNMNITYEHKEDVDELIKKLENIDISYSEREVLWVDEESKERFLNSIIDVEETIEIQEKKQYAAIKVNKKFYKEIYKEIEQNVPGALLSGSSKDEKKGVLIVDQESIEKVNKVIKKYEEKTPYWIDHAGGFYYLDQSVKMLVKHSKPPVNGRLMGTYKG